MMMMANDHGWLATQVGIMTIMMVMLQEVTKHFSINENKGVAAREQLFTLSLPASTRGSMR